MSNRTLVEINHDYYPGTTDGKLLIWARCMCDYIRSGNPSDLPEGMIHKGLRHHSDPEPGLAGRPMSEAPEDGSWIVVRETTIRTYRYKLYKPDGARQMQARGRWQRATEFSWENCPKPEGEWLPEGRRFVE
jgi:hypothetical protein